MGRYVALFFLYLVVGAIIHFCYCKTIEYTQENSKYQSEWHPEEIGMVLLWPIFLAKYLFFMLVYFSKHFGVVATATAKAFFTRP